MKKYHIIYKLTNTVNGLVYIGQHSTNKLNDGYMGSGLKIREAIRKYGKHQFRKEILALCDTKEELDELEIFFISIYNSTQNGYNIAKGGRGQLGISPSVEARRKASISRRKFYAENPDVRVKLSKLASMRVGALNPFYGKTLTQEHISKLTESRIKAISGTNNPSARAVRCVETGKIYNLAKDAAEDVGLLYSTTIIKCCRKQRKLAGGFHWEYA